MDLGRRKLSFKMTGLGAVAPRLVLVMCGVWAGYVSVMLGVTEAIRHPK